MADDKKIIFSMVGVNKIFPPQKQVLKNIYLSFFYGAKIGIIGLNGSGKSTLLKIIAGIDKDYQGEVVFSPGYSVGYLEQDPKLEPGKTVKEIVQEGVQEIVDTLKEYEEVNERFGDPEVLEDPDKMDALINRQAELQDKIDATDAWNLDSRLERAMDALRCPPEDQVVDTLSGGERRRVALCRLLLQQPDVLLLDEPTNHLDAESIDWLEQHLQQYAGTVICITHDRYFLDHVAGWILELDRGEGIPWKGNYSSWLDQKTKRMAQEEKQVSKRRKTLERELDIPVFHDDQHGTAIVVTAALINALRVVGKKMEDVHIVLNGPGAAGTAIIKMLMTAGAKDIIAVDQFGTLYKGCNSSEAHKNWLGEVTNPRQIKGGLKEALEGADVFIGVSKPGILTTELCKTMNKDAIVFAMANPTPEIMPDEAKAGGVRVMATGRSDFPNQVNNVLCFPGLFKGALSVRARDINDKMKLAAAYAIADLITDDDRSEENIIPGAFDPRVAQAVADAVAQAARDTGVARL
mgnify:CR=1 FL=1